MQYQFATLVFNPDTRTGTITVANANEQATITSAIHRLVETTTDEQRDIVHYLNIAGEHGYRDVAYSMVLPGLVALYMRRPVLTGGLPDWIHNPTEAYEAVQKLRKDLAKQRKGE
jgi:hypothetical protein